MEIPTPRTDVEVGAHTAELINELDLNTPDGIGNAMQILVEQGFAMAEWDDASESMQYTVSAGVFDAMKEDPRWEGGD